MKASLIEIYPELKGEKILSIRTEPSGCPETEVYIETEGYNFTITAVQEGWAMINDNILKKAIVFGKLAEEYLLHKWSIFDSWGCNNHPSIEYVLEILKELPIAELKMNLEKEQMELRLHRTMNQAETFQFVKLGFKEPREIEKNQLAFSLQW